jgi:hypothetical protein
VNSIAVYTLHLKASFYFVGDSLVHIFWANA